ncbi:Protein IMPACT-like protein [Colletotrichum truncatum]|uniref:Protein IMPACT-like protein n=1 Tax=Colletotrichum truncatum TaxID=5467 RepID=A0ACC3ZIK6_COLTU|nr:Protein IMPACT-like protein [Colletotrichum truncatum]KAF6786773.1 Protein IMPACT-like protein [Colletotrichum truncatum]
MSDDLKDEIEVINSIYGDGTLAPSPPDYILALPGAGSSSLTLRLPETYPDVPPQVLGTHSTGENAPRGAGARDLALFRDAIATVYQPGAVCLFDAIEEFQRWAEASVEAQAAARSPSPEAREDDPSAQESSVPDYLAEEPPWILSDPFVELKSVFVARAAPVTSPEKAAAYVKHLLATDKKARTATHNMTAWRIRGPNGTSFQDCDDDGETAAGGRLLHLMQLMDLWDVMVVVTRWYGGQKLGPRRFALINSAARDAFVKAGWVEEAGQGKKKGK